MAGLIKASSGLLHANSASPLLIGDAVKALDEGAKDTGHLSLASPALPPLAPIRSGIEQMYIDDGTADANDSFKVCTCTLT